MRHELKYSIAGQDLPRLMEWLASHPWFQRAYPDRPIFSMYFDTPGLDAAQDNVDGISIREKHRIRWYANPDGEPVGARYEIKYKRASLSSKHVRTCPLSPAALLRARTPDIQELVAADAGARELGGFPSLIPSLLVGYRRSYFAAFEDVRLTLDRELTFTDMHQDGHLLSRRMTSDRVVVEIKADQDKRDYLSQQLRDFPLTRVRTSKYVLGLSQFGYVNYI